VLCYRTVDHTTGRGTRGGRERLLKSACARVVAWPRGPRRRERESGVGVLLARSQPVPAGGRVGVAADTFRAPAGARVALRAKKRRGSRAQCRACRLVSLRSVLPPSKKHATFDFWISCFTIRLIQIFNENIIYFLITYVIIIYILIKTYLF
jgi:hypothetical protein